MNAVVEPRMPVQRVSLMARVADRFGVDPKKMHETLKATAFRVKDGPPVTDEQLMALLIVADQYGLNPFTKEIYAFPDKQSGGIVPVVGVDGWLRIINSHPEFDGIEYADGPEDKHGRPSWIECRMFRRDRSHPIVTREYMTECWRDVGPWRSHPRRMLRHKATIQCSRVAFGFAGFYDPDEAERIIDGEARVIETSDAVSGINARVAQRRQPDALEAPAREVDEVPTRSEAAREQVERAAAPAPARQTRQQQRNQCPAPRDEERESLAPPPEPGDKAEPDAGPPPTLAEVTTRMKAATTMDELNAAAADAPRLPDADFEKADQVYADQRVRLLEQKPAGEKPVEQIHDGKA